MTRRAMALAAAWAAITLTACAQALAGAGAEAGHLQHLQHTEGHAESQAGGAAEPMAERVVDVRQLVAFPALMRAHTLANMRDHLQTLGLIQHALAMGAFDEASALAENRLGMSSLVMHGAHDVAGFMPQGMQEAGTAMHRSASQFALVAKDASATGDLKATLAALARLNQTCVACHAGYRLQ